MNWEHFRETMNTPRLFAVFFDILSEQNTVPASPWDDALWRPRLGKGEWVLETHLGSHQARLRSLRTRSEICLEEVEMYRLMKRFLSGIPVQENAPRKEIALVLTGGGAKGAYQIGVWQAIRELGLEELIGGISGTSIGSLNTLLFALGDLENAVRLWDELSNPVNRRRNREKLDRLTRHFSDRLWKYGPLAPFRVLTEDLLFISQEELRHELALAISGKGDQIKAKYELFSSAVDITPIADLFSEKAYSHWQPTGALPQSATYFYWNRLCAADIVKAVLASAAIPVWYDPVLLHGRYYCDGGVRDNVPVKPLYDCGFRRFVIVYLKRKDSEEYQSVQRQLAAYGDCRAIQVTPDFDGGLAAVLDLNPETTKERRKAGYRDAMDQIRRQIRLLI